MPRASATVELHRRLRADQLRAAELGAERLEVGPAYAVWTGLGAAGSQALRPVLYTVAQGRCQLAGTAGAFTALAGIE
jgi:multidrug transporter EmrE-like cation transporter